MEIAALEQKILEKRAWLQSVADHTVELATMDPQARYAFRMAQEKLSNLDRSLRRIHLGTYGWCDECSGAIEPERLEFVADQERHLCASCASALSARSRYLPSRQADRTLRSRLPMALAAG